MGDSQGDPLMSDTPTAFTTGTAILPAVPAAPSFPVPPVLTNGFIHLVLAGEAYRNYGWQSSSDLVNWTAIATNMAPSGRIDFFDPFQPGLPAVFYRVQALPDRAPGHPGTRCQTPAGPGGKALPLAADAAEEVAAVDPRPAHPHGSRRRLARLALLEERGVAVFEPFQFDPRDFCEMNRSIDCTCRASSATISVSASPLASMRPVRPIRWM